MTIFARIDQAAGAREVGLQMPPRLLLLFGSPKGGAPIMQAASAAALELPMGVLMRESAGDALRLEKARRLRITCPPLSACYVLDESHGCVKPCGLR
jgi:uncharacterized protein (DUF302 family)